MIVLASVRPTAGEKTDARKTVAPSIRVFADGTSALGAKSRVVRSVHCQCLVPSGCQIPRCDPRAAAMDDRGPLILRVASAFSQSSHTESRAGHHAVRRATRPGGVRRTGPRGAAATARPPSRSPPAEQPLRPRLRRQPRPLGPLFLRPGQLSPGTAHFIGPHLTATALGRACSFPAGLVTRSLPLPLPQLRDGQEKVCHTPSISGVREGTGGRY